MSFQFTRTNDTRRRVTWYLEHDTLELFEGTISSGNCHLVWWNERIDEVDVLAIETFGLLQRTERTLKLPIGRSCRDISCLIDAWNWSEESKGLTGSSGWPCMLRVRKRCVNWLYLAISWSGPCCPVFLGPDGGDGGLLGPTWKGSRRSGRGPQGSGHLFVEAARPDTPLVFLRPSSLGALEGRVERRSTRKKGALSSGTHGQGTRRRVLDIWDTATSRCSIFLFSPPLSLRLFVADALPSRDPRAEEISAGVAIRSLL